MCLIQMLPVEKVVPYAYTERKPIQDADYRWHNEDQSFDEVPSYPSCRITLNTELITTTIRLGCFCHPG